MKKLFPILIVFALLMGVSSASDGIIIFQKDAHVQFDDINFTIPEGFGERNSNGNMSDVSFVNEKNETIDIVVGPANFDGNYTMFGSRMGYLNQSNTSVTFSYFENNRYVSVSAPSQQILLKVLGD